MREKVSLLYSFLQKERRYPEVDTTRQAGDESTSQWLVRETLCEDVLGIWDSHCQWHPMGDTAGSSVISVT